MEQFFDLVAGSQQASICAGRQKLGLKTRVWAHANNTGLGFQISDLGHTSAPAHFLSSKVVIDNINFIVQRCHQRILTAGKGGDISVKASVQGSGYDLSGGAVRVYQANFHRIL